MLERLESRPAPIQEQIASFLRSELLKGRYRPGERLPSARELASDIGHSPTTVLEAYRILAAEGLIEVREKSRPRVRDSDTVLSARHRMLDDKTIGHVRDLRMHGFSDDEIHTALQRQIRPTNLVSPSH